MRMIRALTALSLCVALALPALAGERTYVRNYDVASTSFIYCSTTDYVQGLGRIATSGSATAVTGTNTTFLKLVAGDEIFVQRPAFAGSPNLVTDRRVVQTTPTSNTALTITAVANWTGGFAWRYRKVSCGTGAEDGWITTGEAKVDVEWYAATVNATSVSFQVQCRNTGDSWRPANTVYPDPDNSASTVPCRRGSALDANDGAVCRVIGAGIYSECRCGIQVNTDTGVQDISCGLTTQDPNLPGAR